MDGSGNGEDRGVSVALTRNYLSASYLSSGCRDRAETVPPEALGSQSSLMVTAVAAAGRTVASAWR